jgi:hypothetical protein
MLQSTTHSHRRIIVIHALLNKRLNALCLLVVFFLSCATSSAPKDDALSVQGVVVAIQRGEKDARLIEPESFADLAEIYMVRADRWSPSDRKEKYIIVEYVHHAGLIEYEQFNKTHWILELHQQSPEVNQECLSWITSGATEELKFVPTSFGAKTKLPNPKTLSCFLITKRPSVAR